MNFITVYHSKASIAQLATCNMTYYFIRTIFECMRLRFQTKTANKASSFL